MRVCTHTEDIDLDVEPQPPVGTDGRPACLDCMIEGTRWVHLRMCTSCGHVGCCDDSPRRHATAHFHDAGHPVIQSFEPGETWLWCFVDGTAVRL